MSDLDSTTSETSYVSAEHLKTWSGMGREDLVVHQVKFDGTIG